MKKKWDKRFLAGCFASVIVFGAVMGLFVNGVFSFLGRAKSEGSDTLIKRSVRLLYSVTRLKDVIRRAWNIWRSIMESRSTGSATTCSTAVLLPISCRISP